MLNDELLERTMRRAFALAALGPAHGINPQVGCVLLRPDGTVLAEGYHRGAGTAHAEVDALSQLAPGEAAGAIAVVSLEPCNHTGRTGPCAQALIAAGVGAVVHAVSDPGEASSAGAQTLRDAGIPVTSGLLREEGEALLGDWLTSARLRRPVITVKWASTLDGRAAAADGSSKWITSAPARADVHLRRSQHEAIAVGTGTVLADDPALTARDPEGALYPDQPVPVVFGRRPVPESAALHAHPREFLTVTGADLGSDLTRLWELGVHSLFVEGGPALASAFLAAGVADTVLVYLAPSLLGGPKLAVTDLGIDHITQKLNLSIASVDLLGPDIRIIAHPTTGGN